MLCFKRFSYLSVFVFSVFACTLLSITITSGDVFAEAHTWSYDWGDSSSSQTVTPVPGHSSDNTFCGYKYFYVSHPTNILGFRFNFSANGASTAVSISNVSGFVQLSLYGSFNLGNVSVANCRVDPFYRSDYSVVLSDEPLDFVPSSSIPTGTLSIIENGTYDVTNYASAVVDVPPIYGDYHDDLVNIKKAIYTGCAVLLVLYFFYCIYRMIIKGVKK